MALSLKDPVTDNLARQVAHLTGETLTEAVRTALAERLGRERLKRGRPVDLNDELEMIASRFDALPVLDDRTADEIPAVTRHPSPAIATASIPSPIRTAIATAVLRASPSKARNS